MRSGLLGWARLSGAAAQASSLGVPPRVSLALPTLRQSAATRVGHDVVGWYSTASGGLSSGPLSAGRLRELRAQSPHSAIQAVETHGADSTASIVEYIKALVETGRLDTSSLPRVFGVIGSVVGGSSSAYMAYSLPPSPQLSSTFTVGGGSVSGAGPDYRVLALPPSGQMAVKLEPTSGMGRFWKNARFAVVVLGACFVYYNWRPDARASVGGTRGGSPFRPDGLSNPSLEPYSGPVTKFTDVKGVDGAKEELVEVVQFLKDPEAFSKLGGKLPKGLLLTGPPGTGKTLLARAVAGEAGVPFFHMSGSEFDEMFVGIGARRMRELFAKGRASSPCIIFIDEIDGVGSKRNPRDLQYSRMTLNQLLVEMDGFKASSGVVVIGATNFPESLDNALVRPGRFDRTVHVGLPDIKGRKEILELYLGGVVVDPSVAAENIAKRSMGFSGASLANLVNEAALRATRVGRTAITMEDFDYAIDKLRLGKEVRTASRSHDMVRRAAYYEGAVALVAALTPAAEAVHKVTIVPHGSSLSKTAYIPKDDMSGFTRAELTAALDTRLAGRACEEIMFGLGNVATGSAQDIKAATELAQRMVSQFGFGGSATGRVDLNSHRPAPATQEAIEKEVLTLIHDSYDRAKKLLSSHMRELHAIASALLEEETLTGEEIRRLATGGALNKTAATTPHV